MDFNSIKVQIKYDVISNYNGIITVAFSFCSMGKCGISFIIAGESQDILKKLDNFSR